MGRKKKLRPTKNSAPPSAAKKRGSRKPNPLIPRGLDCVEIRSDLPDAAKDTLIQVGRIGRIWGVHGDLTVRPHNPKSDYGWAGETLWLQGEAFPLAAVTAIRWQDKGGKVLVRIAGINNPDDARALTGLRILVPKEQLGETDQDEHFVHELIGMEVIDTEKGPLGKIKHVFSAGASDVFVVHDGTTETLIPAVSDFILRIDTDLRRIDVRYEID